MATEDKKTKSESADKSRMMLIPRLSEKSQKFATIRKYIFVVPVKANKVEVRKEVERQFGVKVERMNMIRVQGKNRRYGRSTGKMSDFKKAIVTLTKDSKEISVVEPA
jgi:large subunit ribosomal protein L23